MHLLRYTLLRLVLVAAAAALLYFAGMRGALLWIVAVVVGFLVAFLALRGSADAAATELARLTRRGKPEPSADEMREDAAALPQVTTPTSTPSETPSATPSATPVAQLEQQADPEE